MTAPQSRSQARATAPLLRGAVLGDADCHDSDIGHCLAMMGWGCCDTVGNVEDSSLFGTVKTVPYGGCGERRAGKITTPQSFSGENASSPYTGEPTSGRDGDGIVRSNRWTGTPHSTLNSPLCHSSFTPLSTKNRPLLSQRAVGTVMGIIRRGLSASSGARSAPWHSPRCAGTVRRLSPGIRGSDGCNGPRSSGTPGSRLRAPWNPE